jgi:hypothetical protein
MQFYSYVVYKSPIIELCWKIKKNKKKQEKRENPFFIKILFSFFSFLFFFFSSKRQLCFDNSPEKFLLLIIISFGGNCLVGLSLDLFHTFVVSPWDCCSRSEYFPAIVSLSLSAHSGIIALLMITAVELLHNNTLSQSPPYSFFHFFSVFVSCVCVITNCWPHRDTATLW